jgi:hypothetical protein
MYQVHVRETPGRPRLALVCSAGLFAVAIAACGLFVWQQSSLGLDDRWTPQGWSVSFAPPAGWERAPLDPQVVGFEGFQFGDPRRGDQIWVGRLPYAEQVSLAISCRNVMGSALQHVRGVRTFQAWAAAAQASVEPSLLGQLTGVHSRIRATGDLFYVGVAAQEERVSEAYLLAFFPADPINARDLRILAAIADSFVVEGAAAEP